MRSMKEALGYRVLMLVCFSMTILSAFAGVLAMIVDPGWPTAATGTGVSGFWFALGLFFEAEQSRERAELRVEHRLKEILKEVKKPPCGCRADALAK